MPLPGKGDPERHLQEAKERFILLRRVGVESAYLADQKRRVDFSLLLENGALTTNRLIAVVQSLPAGSLPRRGFFAEMHFQEESHGEKDSSWRVRPSTVRSLVLAQSKIDGLERSVPRISSTTQGEVVRHCAVRRAVDIAFFLGVWLR